MLHPDLIADLVRIHQSDRLADAAHRVTLRAVATRPLPAVSGDTVVTTGRRDSRNLIPATAPKACGNC